MKKKLLVSLVTGLFLSGIVGIASATTIVNGSIYNIDGDGDGSSDDLLMSQVTFDVTAGTHLFIDSLV